MEQHVEHLNLYNRVQIPNKNLESHLRSILRAFHEWQVANLHNICKIVKIWYMYETLVAKHDLYFKVI